MMVLMQDRRRVCGKRLELALGAGPCQGSAACMLGLASRSKAVRDINSVLATYTTATCLSDGDKNTYDASRDRTHLST